jgi:hypothetical protein
MSDPGENVTATDNVLKLSDAIREVKNAVADRDDVVVDMREAQRMRLELLAAELQPVFADVPTDVENFDFALSSGLQPRLWIDAVSHVAMGRDRRTYRFVRDTRLGRVVLAESAEMKPVAEQVTRYVAERVVERQRMMEGGTETAAVMATASEAKIADAPATGAHRSRWVALLSGLLLILAGAGAGLVVAGALFWERLAALGVSF